MAADVLWSALNEEIKRVTSVIVIPWYGTPRLPYNVYILFAMYKGHFVMHTCKSLCAKCISL